MTKSPILFSILTLSILTACNPKGPSANAVSIEDDTINYIEKEIHLTDIEEGKIEAELQIETANFKGSWFTIDYPSNFTVSPNFPIEKFEDYENVATDEAYFLSADKTIEFFVYSPQWGGNPNTYLNTREGEIIISEKSTIDEILPDQVYKWVTFENKTENYMRSYYSKRNESTHLVFGIKYKNQDLYDLATPVYSAFKKSLVQFAD